MTEDEIERDLIAPLHGLLDRMMTLLECQSARIDGLRARLDIVERVELEMLHARDETIDPRAAG